MPGMYFEVYYYAFEAAVMVVLQVYRPYLLVNRLHIPYNTSRREDSTPLPTIFGTNFLDNGEGRCKQANVAR